MRQLDWEIEKRFHKPVARSLLQPIQAVSVHPDIRTSERTVERSDKFHRVIARAHLMSAVENLNSSMQRAVPAALVLLAMLVFSGDARADKKADNVTPLMTQDLIGVPGKEVLMLTVEYLPGGASVPHRHDANVFVYVLEGAVKMQVAGGLPVTLKPGQFFYESPTDIHVTSANASKTESAKILVFIVKDKGKPVSRLVPPEQ
jgi:quercetin dioxygenase-like cupin family protein